MVKIATTARHVDYYKILRNSWKPCVIRSFEKNEFIPENSEFLVDRNPQLIFKVFEPLPRSLPELDTIVKLYLQIESPDVSLFNSSEAYISFLNKKVFSSQRESLWWNSYRKFVVETTKTGTVVRIEDDA